MGEKTELNRAIDLFVRGEFYCSPQPTTQLHDYDSIKHLAFGTTVGGRTDEFFVYNSNPAHVIEIIDKLLGTAHSGRKLTVLGVRVLPGNVATGRELVGGAKRPHL